MRRSAWLIAGVVSFALGPVALGQVTYLTQTRTVRAFGVSAFGSGGQTNTAPDFSDWNSTAVGFGFGMASQQSSLSPTGITLSGNVAAQQPPATGTGSGSAESTLDVTFQVSAPVGYSLSGFLPPEDPRFVTPPGSTPPARIIHLSNGFTYSAIGTSMDMPPDTGNFSTSGILMPGTYELSVDVAGSAHYLIEPDERGGNYNVSFAVVPEPSCGTIPILGVAMLGGRRRR